ncbi:MAG: glycerophosphoryl diester phosphodiesterase membrane domain-containing protein [Gemmataceae bacterium]
MSDVITCQACGAMLRRSAAMTPGTAIQCPRCDAVFTAPEADGAAAAGITDRPGDALPPRIGSLGGDFTDRPDGPTFGPHWETDIGAWFNAAGKHWSALLGPSIGHLLICGTLLVPFYVGLFLLGRLGTQGGVPVDVGLYLAVSALNQFVIGPLLGLLGSLLLSGSLGVAIRQLSGKPWAFADFLGGFAKFGPLAGWWAVNAALGMVMTAPQTAATYFLLIQRGGGPPPLDAMPMILGATAFGLVLVVVYLYFVVRWHFTLPLIFDRGLGTVEAMRTSWRMTRDHFWGLLGFQIVAGLLLGASALACGVGLLFAYPFVMLAMAAAYLHACHPRRRPRGDED